jgi:hypothetical protein
MKLPPKKRLGSRMVEAVLSPEDEKIFFGITAERGVTAACLARALIHFALQDVEIKEKLIGF